MARPLPGVRAIPYLRSNNRSLPIMNRPTALCVTMLLYCLLFPPSDRGIAAQCTLAGSQSITSALGDFDGEQPIPLTFDMTYCVNTNELLGFTGQMEITTDVSPFPFRATLTRVADGSVQVLDQFGDQANVNGTDLYTLRFEALSNGTADVTFTVGILSTAYEVVVGTGLPVVWERPLRCVTGEKRVDFTWSVSGQEDVAGYALEQSTGSAWTEVHHQSPRGGAGEITYRATSARVGATAYYRVRQLDLDGNFSLSNVVVVPALHTRAYPNPATTHLTLPELPAGTEARLVDAAGRTYALTTNHQKLDVNALPRGVYTLLLGPTAPPQRILLR